jgi:hypothetical protein
MTEPQDNLNQPVESQEKPGNRSTGSLILFLVFAIPMPICVFIYHFVLWFLEQTAITSGSLEILAIAGPVGLLAQAVILSGIVAA